jgi:hypothetical protein
MDIKLSNDINGHFHNVHYATMDRGPVHGMNDGWGMVGNGSHASGIGTILPPLLSAIWGGIPEKIPAKNLKKYPDGCISFPDFKKTPAFY